MKLLLLSDDGTVLDATDTITRDEWENLSPTGAYALLADMTPGLGD